MSKHHGEIIESAIRKSGLAISDVAARSGFARSHMYWLFKQEELDIYQIQAIGDAINHDFSEELPEYKGRLNVSEPKASYNNNLLNCLKEKEDLMKKYITVLEENKKILEMGVQNYFKGNPA